MYKQKNNKTNKNNGITLIALVLTIIVLLVLAGVVISLALGQNGLLFKAKLSKQQQEIALEKDKITTAYGASFVNKDGKYDKERFKDHLRNSGVVFDDDKLNTITESPLKIELIIKHDGYTVTYSIEDGIVNHKVGDDTTTNNTIPADLQVGDTIIYDPTKGVTDQSKLTYYSFPIKGNQGNGGNGSAYQTVVAKSNQNEWIVISTANNQIKVMAKEPVSINGVNYGLFTLKGAIGWLYAEEELHKACSVYGYGKGAKKTTTTYQVGNKYTGEAQTRQITDSGARSITMVDIVQIMKGDQYLDFTEDEKKGFNYFYMHPNYKSLEVYYPTINTYDKMSTDKKIFEYDNYFINSAEDYYKELVPELKVKENKAKLKNYIYIDRIYYISSRCANLLFNKVNFNVNIAGNVRINSNFCIDSNKTENTLYGDLRPVVYLDGNMLEKQAQGVWKIKD